MEQQSRDFQNAIDEKNAAIETLNTAHMGQISVLQITSEEVKTLVESLKQEANGLRSLSEANNHQIKEASFISNQDAEKLERYKNEVQNSNTRLLQAESECS